MPVNTIKTIDELEDELENAFFYKKMNFCTKFWQDLLDSIVKKHSFQNDFVLGSGNFAYEEIVSYLWNKFRLICKNYGLSFRETTSPHMIEFIIVLPFGDPALELGNELSIIVNKKNIILKIKSTHYYYTTLKVCDYIQVENIVAEICEELIDNKKMDQYVLDYTAFMEEFSSLTPKSLQIAINSIKALYEASNQPISVLEQHTMYSTMLINEKSVEISHKDYLKNPDILVRLLAPKKS